MQIKIHQFNEPASGTCDQACLIITFELRKVFVFSTRFQLNAVVLNKGHGTLYVISFQF